MATTQVSVRSSGLWVRFLACMIAGAVGAAAGQIFLSDLASAVLLGVAGFTVCLAVHLLPRLVLGDHEIAVYNPTSVIRIPWDSLKGAIADSGLVLSTHNATRVRVTAISPQAKGAEYRTAHVNFRLSRLGVSHDQTTDAFQGLPWCSQASVVRGVSDVAIAINDRLDQRGDAETATSHPVTSRVNTRGVGLLALAVIAAVLAIAL